MPDNTVVRTHNVRVRVFLRSGAIVSGTAHIQPGGYQKRLSDVLNLGQVRYIAVTGASYESGPGPVTTTDCVLVNVQDISMIDAAPLDANSEVTWEPNLPDATGPAGSSM